MPQSPILGITQVAPNQNNKETTINDGFSAIERSLNDRLEVAMGVGDATLTPEDFRRHGMFFCTGHSSPRIMTIPKQKRIFAVHCGGSGNGSVTVRMEGQTTPGVVVNPGSYVIMYADGDTKIEKIADSAAASLAPAFIGLVDTPTSYENTGGMFLRVRSTGDGIEFDELTFADLSDVGSYAGSSGKYPRVRADGSGLEFVSANPGGETEFLRLNDVPSTYAEHKKSIVRVNDDGNGLVFEKKSEAFSIRDLTDVPNSFDGQRGKLLAVDANSRFIEFVDAPDATAKRTVNVELSDGGFNGTMGENGWVVTAAPIALHQTVIEFDALKPTEGGLFYVFEGTETTSGGQVTQTVDLTRAVTQAEINAGAKFTLSGRFATLGSATAAQFTIEAISDGGAVLSVQTSEKLTSPRAWGQFQIVLAVPFSTARVRIHVATSGALVSAANPVAAAAFDGFIASLEVVEDLTFKNLNDTPDSYEGEAGKVVRVKADASGLEFFNLAVSFLGLTDAPTSYEGSAGKLLMVNEGENSIEFRELKDAVTIENIGGSPGPLDGRAGFYLRVREDELGLEYIEFVDGVGGEGGASRLSQLLDVSLDPAPTQGQALSWDVNTRRWRPMTVATSGGSNSGGGGINDAPSDGKAYARKNSQWVLLRGDAGNGDLVVFKESVSLVNPSAESASMTGWTVSPANSMSVKTIPAGSITAAHRGAFIFGAAAVPLASMSQDIDVTRYSEMVRDGIATFTFTAMHASGYAIPEASILRVDAIDRNGTILAGNQTSDVSPADGVWSPIQVALQLPVGTEKLRLTATTKRLAGANNDNYFDSFEGQFSAVFGIVDAPKDGKSYVRKDQTWVEVAIPSPNLSGLSDVTTTGAQTGFTLVYDATAKKWVAKKPEVGIADAPADGVTYARKDGKWVLVTSGGGGGGSSGSFRGAASEGFTGTYTFESGVIPGDLSFDMPGASIVALADLNGDPVTTKALRFPKIPDNGVVNLTFPLTLDAAGPVYIRASSDSESATFDYLSFYVNGIETSTADRVGGIEQPPRTITINLGAGTHTLGIRYRKDGSGSRGADTGYIHSIVVPGFDAPSYGYGDIVTYLGSHWFCLSQFTKGVPASSPTEWVKIPNEFTLPPIDGKTYAVKDGAWVAIAGAPGSVASKFRLDMLRVPGTDQANAHPSLTEVVFFDAAGNKIKTPITDVVVSGEYDATGRPKSALIDGNTTTYWTADTPPATKAAWAEFTFASEVAPASIYLVGRSDRMDQFPSTGRLVAIVGGQDLVISTWDDRDITIAAPGKIYPVGAIPGATVGEAPKDGNRYHRRDGLWVREKDASRVPITAKVWRFDVSETQGNNFGPRISEIEFLDADGYRITTSPASVTTTSDSNEGGGPAAAFDGKPATFARGNSGVPHWIEATFTEAIEVYAIRMSVNVDHIAGPKAFTVRADGALVGTATNIPAWTSYLPFELPITVPAKPALADAPSDDKTYGRKNGEWAEVVAGSGTGGDGGSSGPAQQFKHYRVLVNAAPSSSYVGFAEVVFGTIGDAGSPFAQSQYEAFYAPEKAFDGQVSTYWASASGKTVGEYIGFTFTTPKTISKVVLTQPQNQPSSAPTAFSIQGSNSKDRDNAVWTTIKSFAGVIWSNDNPTQTFEVPTVPSGGLVDEAEKDGLTYARKNGAWTETVEMPPADGQARVQKDGSWITLKDANDEASVVMPEAGKHKHWRIRALSSVHASYVAITEIVFRKFIGSAQAATGGTPRASGNYTSSSGPEKAFDGNLAGTNFWESNSSPVANGTTWISYEFPEATFISQVTLYSSTGEADESLQKFLIEYSDDRVSWTEAYRGDTGFINDNSKVQEVTVSLPGAVENVSNLKPVASSEVRRMMFLTREAYDALPTKDSTILYLIP